MLARDAHGNRRRVGGDRFVVSFRGPCNPVARVHDRADGTYRCTYVAAVSGTCLMSVTLNRVHVQGSPFKLTVEGPGRAAPGGAATPVGVPSTRAHQLRADRMASPRGARP